MSSLRTCLIWRLAVLVMLPTSMAQASCLVTGGGPIVDGSEVICSGATVGSVIAPTANNVTVTVMPGATLNAGGAPRAIHVGNNANVTVSATALVVGTPGSVDPVVTVGSNSILSVAGVVRTLGPGRTVAAFLNSVVSVSGQLDGDFGLDPAIYFIQLGATAGNAFLPTYMSTAGTVASVQMAVPFFVESELYNEPGGNIQAGVVYTAETVFNGYLVFSNIDSTIVNRGLIGARPNGYAIQSTNRVLSDLQFSNELNAVVQGDVEILRAFEAGQGTGSNLGSIQGSVLLPVPVTDAPAYVFGLPQHFDNHGLVRSIDISSGEFVQAADGSFASSGSLRVAGSSSLFFYGSGPPPDNDFFGTLTLAGTQQTSCLQGSSATQAVGGVVDLQATSTLTVAPSAAQLCRFDGTLIGSGRLVKQGAGVQIVGAVALPQFWSAPRPATSFSGGTSVVAGTLASTASDAFGTGPVSFDGANARLRLDANALVIANALAFNAAAVMDTNGFDTTLVGPSSGSASVRKTGAGTLHWTGDKSHTGTTTVDGGVLRVPGAMPGSVVVAAAGTLAGAAQIVGATTVQSAGVLRPSAGDAAGLLLQTGALTMSAGATLRLAIDGTARDQIRAITATLGGATLALDFAAANAIGTQITLIDITGGGAAVSPFVGLPEGALIYQGDIGWRISYVGGNGNDVTLTATAAPLAPQSITATPGDQQITLGFVPPAANAAGPITGYRAQCAPSALIVEAPTSPIIVSGLTNGVAYTCTLRTLTATTASAQSAPLIATPLGPASMPLQLVPTAGVAQFSVGFSPPLSNGGTPISGYRLTCQPGDLLTQGAGSPLGFSGLVNGAAYSCGLAAVTEFGNGAVAAFSITPRTVPNAPTGLAATPYNASARFDFTAPAFDGGANITSYTLRCPPGNQNTVTGAASPLWLTGLNNGNTYNNCTVRATNVAGNSLLSAAVSVTPLAVPSEIRNPVVVNSDGGSGVAFTTPLLGAPILDYNALCMPGALSFTQASSPIVLLPLGNGVDYACAITARNSLGSGPPVSVEVRPSLDLFGNGFE